MVTLSFQSRKSSASLPVPEIILVCLGIQSGNAEIKRHAELSKSLEGILAMVA